MRMKFVLAFVWIAVWASLAVADQVVLKNGDRVTGKVVKKDQGSLTFKSNVFGAVTIPWGEVVELNSEDPVTVVLPDGKSVIGKVATSDGRLRVVNQASTESAMIGEVSSIRDAAEQRSFERLQHPGPLNLWAGRADVGISIASGNSQSTTSAISMAAVRETHSDKTGIHFTEIYARGKNAQGIKTTTADAIRGGWAYDRKLNSRAFLNLLNDYEYDSFQDLDLRFVLGGGAGYAAARGERLQLDLVGGADYNREKYGAPLTRQSAEAYWGNNLAFKVAKATTLTQNFRMFNNLSDTGEYRMNFDAGTSTQLLKWLGWHITASDRYLSNPLAGRKSNDILLTTGLRISFAR
jgi:putative salt-induced outer membrane protein YdiY